jgi:soluble lytic murein transglycosylase
MNLNGPDPTANRIFWILVIAFLFAMRSAYPEQPTPQKPPAYIATILRNAEIQHDLPIGLAVCIAWHESSYKPTATSRYVGGYRSRGLMQIYHKNQSEIVHKYTNIPVNMFDWKNPRHSAQAGCGYLAYLIDRFDGDLYLAVLAYNWGEGNVSGLIAGRLDWDGIPAHCTNYAKNVLWMLDNVVCLW